MTLVVIMDEQLHISDAEWRIMHEVWLDEPITSGELVERLTSSTQWTPTTIKTLLHRLVKKGALAYYRKGKTLLLSKHRITFGVHEECKPLVS